MIKINGIQIKEPMFPDIESYNLTKSGRTADGTMVIDLVAKKRKLLFSYPVLAGDDLQQILDLIDGNEMFFEVEWMDNNKVQKATMYVGSIKKTKFRTGSRWYWKNVTFNFIEK